MKELGLKILLWLLNNIGLWECIFIMILFYTGFFLFKRYTDKRKDKRERAIIDAKEDQIKFMAKELRELKIQLLIKNGHTIKQAERIINGDN